MKTVLFITAFVLLSGIYQVNAQTEKPYWGLYGAIALPRGDFGSNDTDEDKSGLAKTGFGAGVEHTYPLSSPGLSWVSNVSFILNGFDGEALKDMFEDEDVDVNVDAGNWINIPVMTGIKYQLKGSSNMSFYGMAQAGLNFVKGPKIEINSSVSEYDVKETITWDFTSSFGFSIGGGIILNEKYAIGIRYLMLGEPDIKTTAKISINRETEEVKDKKEQPISILLLTVGIRF